MRYELMLPHQIRTAIDERLAGRAAARRARIPRRAHGGRHGHARRHQNPRDPRKRDEPRHPAALLLWRGELRGGAAGRHGTLHVDAEALLPFAKAMFHGLLRIGFRNIHVIIHHQTENFAAGMPTDLAFKFAARQAIFAFLEKERGEGWWGAK